MRNADRKPTLTGILPVAGRGTRMLPLTKDLPKALVEIGDETLLAHAIRTLTHLGVDDVVVIIGRDGNLFGEAVADLALGLPIRFIHQPEPKGLVHALALARSHVSGDAVLLCPDNLFSDQADLDHAAEVFQTERSEVVQVATFAGDHQEGRTDFDLASLRRIAPNTFRFAERRAAWAGIPIRSTGMTFFSGAALARLPDRFGDEELTLAAVLVAMREQVDFVVTCLRGARDDITAPDDIEAWQALEKASAHADRVGVSAILRNREGAVLMQLRDEGPGIRFPGTWGLFGGSVDGDESPNQAIVREIEEELGYTLTDYGLIRRFIFEGKLEYAYLGLIDARIEDLTLCEGRDFGFFTPTELEGLAIRPDDRATLACYFGWSKP